MLNKMLKVAITLSAYDKMSGTVAAATKKSENSLKHFQSVAKNNLGGAAISIGGVAGAAAIAKPVIDAYSRLEDASLNLKSVMLRDGNQINEGLFKKVNNEAIRLGNKLPGTTAEFQTLFATMLETGTSAESILRGSGEAAAYLAVQMGLPTEEAGRLAGKLQNAMAIPDKQMMQWMDFMSRMKNVNVEATEMQYAFAKSAMPMKMLGVQGIKAGKIVGNFFAQAIAMGQNGETIGTAFGRILNEVVNPKKYKAFQDAAKQYGVTISLFDKKGQFKGIENFMTQFYQFQGMDPTKIAEILATLTGGEGVDSGLLQMLAMNGADTFNAMNKRLKEQATLTDKVNLKLAGFKNMWEATTGTFENFLAEVGASFAPEMKMVVEWMGKASAKMQGFAATHPIIFKTIAIISVIIATLISLNAVIALTRGAWALMALFGLTSIGSISYALFALRYTMMFTVIPALSAMTGAVWAFTAALFANPITWIVLAVVALGVAFYVAYKKSETFRAVLSGLLSVGKLLLDVFAGLGKIAIGTFSMDMSMIKEGISQTAQAQLSIMTGGMGRAFMDGYKNSLASEKSMPASSVPKPVPVSKGGNTSFTFAPEINLNGSATKEDANKLNKAMRPEFDRMMKDYEQRNARRKY